MQCTQTLRQVAAGDISCWSNVISVTVLKVHWVGFWTGIVDQPFTFRFESNKSLPWKTTVSSIAPQAAWMRYHSRDYSALGWCWQLCLPNFHSRIASGWSCWSYDTCSARSCQHSFVRVTAGDLEPKLGARRCLQFGATRGCHLAKGPWVWALQVSPKRPPHPSPQGLGSSAWATLHGGGAGAVYIPNLCARIHLIHSMAMMDSLPGPGSGWAYHQGQPGQGSPAATWTREPLLEPSATASTSRGPREGRQAMLGLGPVGRGAGASESWAENGGPGALPLARCSSRHVRVIGGAGGLVGGVAS